MNDFVNRFSSAKPGAGQQGVEDVHELMQDMNPGGVGLPIFALPPLPDVGRISEGCELLLKKRGLTPLHPAIANCVPQVAYGRPRRSVLPNQDCTRNNDTGVSLQGGSDRRCRLKSDDG